MKIAQNAECAFEIAPQAAISENPAKTAAFRVHRLLCDVWKYALNPLCRFHVRLFQLETRRLTRTLRDAILSSPLDPGLFTAGVLRSGVHQPRPRSRERALLNEGLIRPPGALPEAEFLANCIRCGECMKACPTNTLQPIWFKAGLEGIFTPVMLPRLAACAVNCNVCGKVCPTGAIRDLPLIEKNHAKTGTAWINRQNCLVWERDKKCLVCDEVCPYGAVSFQPVPDRNNAAPFVIREQMYRLRMVRKQMPSRRRVRYSRQCNRRNTTRIRILR